MAKADMPAVNTWPSSVNNRNKQPITSTASMTLNPVEVYKRLLSRTCSAEIRVDAQKNDEITIV